MMKTKIIKLSIMLASITLLFSCSEDFLNDTRKGVLDKETYYQTDDQAQAALYAVYDILGGMNSYDWNSEWLVKTMLADEAWSGGGKRNDQPGFEEANEFTYDATNGQMGNDYKYLYWAIYRANLVIDNVSDDSQMKKIAIAEAKALRAYSYFELVTLWGDVPLVLHELAPSEYQQARTPKADVYAQIETDLKAAMLDLPIKSDQAALGIDKARVAKGFAQAMLGKAYLYEEKFADAATQFQAVIDSKEYSLAPNFADVLRQSQEFGVESLFELSYSNTFAQDWGNFQWGNIRRQESNITFQLCGPRGDGWFDQGTTGLVPGWGFCYPQAHDSADFAADDTIRRKASVMTESELIAQGGKLRDGAGTLPHGCVGLIRLKYGTWASESGGSVTELNYGTNLRIMRYADVLLMAAEAYVRNNQAASALVPINEVRARVLLPALSSVTLDDIKAERRSELMFEGVRYQDLIRWGDAADVLKNQGKLYPNATYTGTEEDWLPNPNGGFKVGKNELLPIPDQEMSVNANMVQNPGY